MPTLFIFGNGFDLHHNLPTSYNDFKNYVSSKRPDLLNKIKKYERSGFFHGHLKENWSNIENALAFNIEKIHNNEKGLYPLDIYSDIEEVFKTLFFEWVQNIEKTIETTSVSNRNLKLSPNDYYFTFNYTQTLNYQYNIDRFSKKDKSCHIINIHGVYMDEYQELAQLASEGNPFTFGPTINKKRYEEGNFGPLQKLYLTFNKDPKSRFNSHLTDMKAWIDEIDSVKVYGHSLDFTKRNETFTNDGYYFLKIEDMINEIERKYCPYRKKNIKWMFYYHRKEDIPKIKKAIDSLGLNKCGNCSIRPEWELYTDEAIFEMYSKATQSDYSKELKKIKELEHDNFNVEKRKAKFYRKIEKLCKSIP